MLSVMNNGHVYLFLFDSRRSINNNVISYYIEHVIDMTYILITLISI